MPPNQRPLQPSRTRARVGSVHRLRLRLEHARSARRGPPKRLRVTEFQLALALAIPLVLGSLMRIPVGILTERYGGRSVFTALMAYSVIPLVLLALDHRSYLVVIALGFLLGVAGASFSVGVPFVNRWYGEEHQGFALDVYGMGIGGTVLAGLTVPKIAKNWGLAAPFWVAACDIALMTAVFWLSARDAPTARPSRKLSP